MIGLIYKIFISNPKSNAAQKGCVSVVWPSMIGGELAKTGGGGGGGGARQYCVR